MTTMIVWVFFALIAGIDHPIGNATPNEELCKVAQVELQVAAREQNRQILALSDCVPISLKDYSK